MGNFRTIPLLVVLVCGILSCEKQPDQPVEPEKVLSLQFKSKSVKSQIAYFDLSVQANCNWKIENTNEWISITPVDTLYRLSNTLSFKVDENTKTTERQAEVYFRYGDKIDTLSISQAAFDVYLNVSKDKIDFGYRTAEIDILVTSNCGWMAKSDESWIAIKPSTGMIGNFDMNINVETNNTTAERQGKIRIWNDEYELEKFISITQVGQKQIETKDYIDEYGINWGKGCVVRGLAWAPVNCGYQSDDFPFGKVFQWGRKTGLGYHDGTYNDISNPSISEIWNGKNGEEKDDTFYKFSDNSKFNYDWIMEGDDSFWNQGTEEYPIKNGTFDPCPDGWRVPTAFEFKSLIDYVSKEWVVIVGCYGFNFTDDEGATLFLPAGGRLNVTDGKAYDRNSEGYYWSISTNAGSSAYLYFYSKDCSVNKQGSRAGGCLVRCIKE